MKQGCKVVREYGTWLRADNPTFQSQMFFIVKGPKPSVSLRTSTSSGSWGNHNWRRNPEGSQSMASSGGGKSQSEAEVDSNFGKLRSHRGDPEVTGHARESGANFQEIADLNRAVLTESDRINKIQISKQKACGVAKNKEAIAGNTIEEGILNKEPVGTIPITKDGSFKESLTKKQVITEIHVHGKENVTGGIIDGVNKSNSVGVRRENSGFVATGKENMGLFDIPIQLVEMGPTQRTISSTWRRSSRPNNQNRRKGGAGYHSGSKKRMNPYPVVLESTKKGRDCMEIEDGGEGVSALVGIRIDLSAEAGNHQPRRAL